MRTFFFNLLYICQIHKLFRLDAKNDIPILLYHRIDNNIDPYWPPTTIENFKSQIKLISKHFNFISLDDLLNGKTKNNSIAIVFDDAYIDIFNNAIPILEKNKIPYTVFIATENCQSTKPIWTSSLDWIVDQNNIETISEKLAFEFQIEINSKSNKIAFAIELQNILKGISNAKRLQVMSFLVKNFNTDTPNWLKVRHLQDIIAENLEHISVELHTHTHPFLPSCTTEEIKNEINESQTIFSSHFNKKSSYIAYPMGGYNDDIIELIKGSFKAAFAVDNKCVDVKKLKSDMKYKYHIPRFNLSNQSAEELLFRVKGFHKKIFNR